MPHPSFRPLADITFWDQYLQYNLLSQDEFAQLTQTERDNLNHELVLRYVKSRVITIERAKSLSKDEFSRLTNYTMLSLFDDKIYPLEELLTLSTRRAQILFAPNVIGMISRGLLSPEEAIRLDSTFDFFDDEDSDLKEDVFYYGRSPEFALQVHTFYIHVSTLFMLKAYCEDFNKRNADLYNIQLLLDPKTATQCCTLVGVMSVIMEEIGDERKRILDSLPEEMSDYILFGGTYILKYYPPSLRFDPRQEIFSQSNGYREYCFKLIKDSFYFLRSPSSNDIPVRSVESEQNRDRRLKTIGLHLNSMWQKAIGSSNTRLKTEEKHSDPSITAMLDSKASLIP